MFNGKKIISVNKAFMLYYFFTSVRLLDTVVLKEENRKVKGNITHILPPRTSPLADLFSKNKESTGDF